MESAPLFRISYKFSDRIFYSLEPYCGTITEPGLPVVLVIERSVTQYKT